MFHKTFNLFILYLFLFTLRSCGSLSTPHRFDFDALTSSVSFGVIETSLAQVRLGLELHIMLFILSKF